METKFAPSPARPSSAGALLREWRTRRRMSQLDLALEAEVSQRHLSFVESGRARPSREMVLHLAERLDVPLRERNRLLLAAGFAPGFPERRLDDPSLGPALAAVELVLKGHEPNPAIAVDRAWNLVRANAMMQPFLAMVRDASLLSEPVNVLRLSLHPGGLAPHIENLAEWRDHLLERLRRLNEDVAEPRLRDLEAELRSYPAPKRSGPPAPYDPAAIAIPLRIRAGDTILSFISTITVFGTPLDVTLSELAIETFFAADRETGERLRQMAADLAANGG
ncbi:helix-turn-helix transcriptional regulator [Aquibium sp. LZ166]|uniref:Helix-turn-helix transcriptional regulator n=1 Tax=Aquibium pacificus TaxID=3153579 RepID=A0ABV3SNY4_9HYPH